jgi:drug/metabolite transporter (DMT)-like permease
MYFQKNHSKGILYACITALMWGVLAIALKLMLNDLDPASVVFVRFSVAFIFLFIIHLIMDPGSLRIFRRPPLLLPVAALFLAYNYYGFIVGLKFTSPASSQVFIQIGPVCFAMGGILFYREMVTRRHLFGFLLLIIGFGLYYYGQVHGHAEHGRFFSQGILWLLSGGVSWSVFALIQKKLLKNYKASDLNLFIYGFCALLFLPFFNFHAAGSLSIPAWSNLIFLGVNTLIAYNCFALAMQYTEANKISVIITLNPVLTFVIMYFLGVFQVSWIAAEHFTIVNISGGFIALVGALMVVLLPERKNKNGFAESTKAL